MKNTQLLTVEQMALLNAAIMEEKTAGVRMHSAERQEAAHLYEMAQLGDKMALSALKNVLEWWDFYFKNGYEAAAAFRDEKVQALIDSYKITSEERGDGTAILH